jgi:hypothetical protein
LTYGARKRRKVLCTHCQKELQERHLPFHLLHTHNIYPDVSAPGSVAISLGRASAPYFVSMPQRRMPMSCPVEGCPACVSDRFGLRRHFMFRHPACTLAILDEGLVPLPRCPSCRMHLPLASVRTHASMALCRQGTLLRQKETLLETYRLAREIVEPLWRPMIASPI